MTNAELQKRLSEFPPDMEVKLDSMYNGPAMRILIRIVDVFGCHKLTWRLVGYLLKYEAELKESRNG